jgi:hypothetical protein
MSGYLAASSFAWSPAAIGPGAPGGVGAGDGPERVDERGAVDIVLELGGQGPQWCATPPSAASAE